MAAVTHTNPASWRYKGAVTRKKQDPPPGRGLSWSRDCLQPGTRKHTQEDAALMVLMTADIYSDFLHKSPEQHTIKGSRGQKILSSEIHKRKVIQPS